MTASAQMITATLPAPPTAAPAVPAPPTAAMPLPAAPLIVIAGTGVPVIPPYALAAGGAVGALTTQSIPSAKPVASGGGLGLLSLTTALVQTVGIGFTGLGSAVVKTAVGPGGSVVVTASFGGTGQIVAPDAGLFGTGQLTALVTPNSGAWAPFYGIGTASAALSYLASFAGTGTPAAPYGQSVGLVEAQAGSGTATATVAVGGRAVVSAAYTGTGMASVTAAPVVPTGAGVSGIGRLTASTGLPVSASGAATLTARTGMPLLAGATGSALATVSQPSAYTGIGGLTAVTQVIEVAAFSGGGGLAGPITSGTASGRGTLSIITAGSAAFGTVGSASAATGGPVVWSGSGTLSAVVTPGFKPSGMTKNGTQSSSSSWTQVTGWSADTANYPGSTVSSNALVSQGGKASATVSASVAWTGGTFGNSIQVRVKQNGTVIATGTTATSSPSTASATVTVGNGDLITVEVIDNSQWSAYPATVTSGASTYTRIT
ncbi:hypothetical protein [Nocardia nepalensis]|uniref:hypothetical protein n=1 Tax=Nocardia nepalensis TaxID=3375448 RepID=UPI003B676833